MYHFQDMCVNFFCEAFGATLESFSSENKISDLNQLPLISHGLHAPQYSTREGINLRVNNQQGL